MFQQSPLPTVAFLLANVETAIETQRKETEFLLKKLQEESAPRVCTTCKILKDAEEYYMMSGTTKRRTQCKDCCRKKHREAAKFIREKFNRKY